MRNYIIDGITFQCEFSHWYRGINIFNVTVSFEEDENPFDIDFTNIFKDIVEKYDSNDIYENYVFTYSYISMDIRHIAEYTYHRYDNTYEKKNLLHEWKH